MDTEYEVETILKAKVFMKGKKMGWKFYVKWKGYEDTDNTWEPFKSFENSGEGIVERFWDRVDTKGRDVNSIEGWTNGEEVYPIGPPRRKSRTSLRTDEPTNARLSTDERPSSRRVTNGMKAKRPSEPLESQRSSKRKRASSSRRKSDTQALQRSPPKSGTPVPDSQSEDELLMVTSPEQAVADVLVDTDAPNLVDQVDHRNAVASTFQGQAEEPEHHDPPSIVPDHVKSQPSTQTMVGDVDFSVASGSQPGADPSQELVVPQARRAKNVEKGLKGRNTSLLTFNKKTGALETLKRKRTVKDNEGVGNAEEVLEHVESTSVALANVVLCSGSPIVGIPPQGSDSTAIATEQMKSASQDNTESHSLPNYEEQSRPSPSSPKIELPDKMPTSISFPEPPSGGSSPWKRATIFGPLAFGAGSPSWATSWGTSDTELSPLIPKPFLLRLDNSISVPAALKDVSSAQAIHHLHLESIVSGTTDPPGKLYTSHAATALLETLETGGSCARLVPGDTASAEHRRVFDAFCTKLGEGGLFVVMASSEVLACCSSTNEDFTKKLELATALRGLSETVVVSHVKVANYSAFADAAAQAENVRW